MDRFTFRKTRWGMTRAEVSASEETPPASEGEDALTFNSTIFDVPCLVYYRFAGDRLTTGGYWIDQANDVSDVTAYLTLSEMLEKKYGEPKRQIDGRAAWRLAQSQSLAEIAKAVSAGDVKVTAEWSTEDTRIMLSLEEDTKAYNAIVALFYWDAKHLEGTWDDVQARDMDQI